MADGFIVRKGGVAVDITAAPSINFVSKTFDSITFTITNNDVLTADIFWEIGDSTPDANTFSLASGATSSNQVASGLDEEETYTIFAFANAEGKAGSQTTSQLRTTPAEPLVFTAATGGTTLEYDSGGKRFKSHTFTSDGNFVVSTVGDATGDRNKVDYLIIAGGGGGGGQSGGGNGNAGGGAGGYRSTIAPTPGDVTPDAKVTVTATTHSVQVGAGGGGGSGSSSSSSSGSKGTDSYIDFTQRITSEGGGGGAHGIISGNISGGNGGSGGGSSGTAGDSTPTPGTGVSGQGFAGGLGQFGDKRAGGGGGGAFAVGGAGSDTDSGDGGNGLSNILRTGSAETRAGGGGAGTTTSTSFPADYNPGTGGTGGGGTATKGNAVSGTAGTTNTGSGGSGAGGRVASGGNGGSGIIVIRYEIAPSV